MLHHAEGLGPAFADNDHGITICFLEQASYEISRANQQDINVKVIKFAEMAIRWAVYGALHLRNVMRKPIHLTGDHCNYEKWT